MLYMLMFFFFASFFFLLISFNLLITMQPSCNDSRIFCRELPLLTDAGVHCYNG